MPISVQAGKFREDEFAVNERSKENVHAAEAG
jgi:hypothetical protein